MPDLSELIQQQLIQLMNKAICQLFFINFNQRMDQALLIQLQKIKENQ